MRVAGRILALAAGAALMAGCGSAATPGNAPTQATVSASVIPALDTSTSSASGTGWAVVKMSDSATPLAAFWELFARPDAAAGWKLVTPAGVASNGGLVMAATGTTSLVAGFLPSQRLTFSPLAVTADGATQWSQNDLLSPGFADVPYALGAGARGQLLALTDAGDVEASTNTGATWRAVATQRTLADSVVGRACGIEALTAAAWTPDDSPVVAARCDKPGVAGIFVLSGGGWHRTALPLPASLSHAAVDVIGLATNGQRTTAILAAPSVTGTAVLAAWSADGGATWRLSPALEAGTSSKPSISIWADGSAGLVQPGAGSGATIGWQSAGWHSLPPLPARTVTLAAAPSGQLQALAASGMALTAWQLAAASNHWTLTQTIRVPVPFGSSG